MLKKKVPKVDNHKSLCPHYNTAMERTKTETQKETESKTQKETSIKVRERIL